MNQQSLPPSQALPGTELPRGSASLKRSQLLAALGMLCVFAVNASAADYIHWRGPLQTGVSPERDLPEKFGLDPKAPDSNLIWRAPYGSRGTPLVLNGKVYLINYTGLGVNQQERVVCLDADTGKLVWEHKFNVFHTGIVTNRLGWTNMTGDPETGNVYAHGTQGMLFCFDGKTGKVLWSHSLTEEYGRVSGYGGRLGSPIVDGDLVIIGMINASWGDQARGANRFVAFNKKDGSVVWWSEPGGPIKGTYYSTPTVAVINGQRLLITGGADGAIHAMKVRTGEPVWSYPFSSVVIDVSPVVGPDGKVYASHGEESPDTNIQGRIVCVDATKIKDKQPELVWKVDGVKAGYASPIVHDNRLYVISNEARLYCYDAQKGEPLWKRPFVFGKLARGSALWADDKIYVFDVNAHFHILKPGPTKCDELHDQFFRNPDGTGFIECNGTPVAVNGRVYLATLNDIYCIGKKDHKTPADKLPPPAAEKPANASAPPATLRVIPSDVVAAPGETVTFKVQAFDENGQLLKEIDKVEWTLPEPPPPPMSTAKPPALAAEVAGGKVTLLKERPFQQGYVQAKVGDATGRARVRVLPPLPIKTNFTAVKGTSPAGWVNCAGKFVMEDIKDGPRVLKKTAIQNAPAPLARANAYIGMPNWTDYTIEADVLGREVQENMPDIGVVANRYTLLLDGKRDPDDKKRRLRITSWDALPRVDHGIVFDWKPDVWYRMKLTVDLQKDKGIVRGKVWPADQKEPEAWTITFEDPTPNREGAPAIYGYAPGIVSGTEALYNNVSVTPNKK